MTAPVKLEPLALKVCAVEGVGAVVEKPVSDEGVALIVGVGGCTTLPARATLVESAPLTKVTVVLLVPSGAVPFTRT